MKRKVEKQVWLALNTFDETKNIYFERCHDFLSPATLTYEVDEPEQTVTITESQARAAITSIASLNGIMQKLGFK